MNRILIDGYYLSKPRGMGRYLQEMLYSLALSEKSNLDIIIVIPKSTKDEDLIYPEKLKYLRGDNLPYPLWEQIYIPFIAKRLNVKVLHSPFNTNPILLRYFQRKIRNVITIHDVMFLEKEHNTHGIYQKLGNLYRKLIVSSKKNKNVEILTVSNDSRVKIRKKLNFDAKVIYTPVNYFHKSNIEKIKSGQEFEGVYIYHVGGLSPHKNTERVIKSFNSINQTDVSLVISGMPKKNYFSDKYNNERIFFTGWINGDQMASLYKNARFVIFPSLREGYGLPIIESFIFEVPLVTSNIDPMKELSKDAALLINPYSEKEISEAMISLLDNNNLRKQLIEEGKKKLSKINHYEMAKQLISVYKGEK